MINVGELLSTTLTEPVLLETPVPPLDTGNAVPESETEIVPFAVNGLPVTDKNAGTVNAMLVIGVVHDIGLEEPPALVST